MYTIVYDEKTIFKHDSLCQIEIFAEMLQKNNVNDCLRTLYDVITLQQVFIAKEMVRYENIRHSASVARERLKVALQLVVTSYFF